MASSTATRTRQLLHPAQRPHRDHRLRPGRNPGRPSAFPAPQTADGVCPPRSRPAHRRLPRPRPHDRAHRPGRLREDLALLFTVIIMAEGIATTLDPGFELFAAMTPFAQAELARELTPAALALRIEQFGAEAADALIGLTGQLHRAL